MKVRVGLITTLNTNIGDDLIREGIYFLVRKIFRGSDVEFVLVNKHRPLAVYSSWHPLRWVGNLAQVLPRGKQRIPALVEPLFYRFGLTSFDRCDVIIQCGAPVLWQNCHRCEWAVVLWAHVIGRLCSRIPVLNLAAGSSYPWEHRPDSIEDPEDARYLRMLLTYCRITTVRDALAQRLCKTLGADTPLIPCTSLLAAGDRVAAAADHAPLLINYMSGGGHYLYDGVDPRAWQATVTTVIQRLKQRHRLAFLCHDEAEYRLAHRLDSTLPRVWPKSPQAYLAVVSEAKALLCNRLHASMALAGLGIPSLSVGTDSRLLMVDAVGLPYLYVKDAHADRVEEELEGLLARRAKERDRLMALRRQVLTQYLRILAAVLNGLDRGGAGTCELSVKDNAGLSSVPEPVGSPSG